MIRIVLYFVVLDLICLKYWCFKVWCLRKYIIMDLCDLVSVILLCELKVDLNLMILSCIGIR